MRVLIDCSTIDFGRQPSGVPRVVLNYVQEGYRWSERTNVPVLPIVLNAHTVSLIRPPPGSRPPPHLGDARKPHPLNRTVRFIGRLSYAGAHRIRSLVRRALYGCEAAWRKWQDTAFIYRLDDRITHLARSIALFFSRFEPKKIRIEPGPGDIMFCPGYWHDVDPKIYQQIKKRGCDLVFLVHDVLPIILPAQYPSPWRESFKANVLAAFDYASMFLCVSNTTRRALAELAEAHGKDVIIDVAHNGHQQLASKPPDYTAPKRKVLAEIFHDERPLLMVGSIEPKKGHVRIIEFLDRKWTEGYGRPLVVVGLPAWMSADIVRRIRTSLHFEKKLFWLHDLDDIDLDYVYSHCHALIFASIAEGFGLPMIEAAMYRKPTIAYRTDIAEEILGGFGIFFDDTDASLSSAIDRIDDSDEYRRAIDRLATFKWPGWRECAATMFDGFVTHHRHWERLRGLVDQTASKRDTRPGSAPH